MKIQVHKICRSPLLLFLLLLLRLLLFLLLLLLRLLFCLLFLFLLLFLLLLPYISQKFIIAHFATSEWDKLHQILKVVSISAKRFTYAFFEFFFSLCLVFSLILSFVGCSYIPKGTFFSIDCS